MKITANMLENTQSKATQQIKLNSLDQGIDLEKERMSLKGIIDSVNEVQLDASKKVTDVELGKSMDMIGAVVASQKASISFSALMQVRNKMVSGINDILKMSL